MPFVYAADIPRLSLRRPPYKVENPFTEYTWEVGVKRVDQALNDFRGEAPDGRRFYATGAAKTFGAKRAVEVTKLGRSWYITREAGFSLKAQAQRAADSWAAASGAMNHFITEDPWLD